MPEPVTTIGLSAIAAYLGKDGLEKLLGPTAEYLGEGLRDLAQKRITNIGRILENGLRKSGDKLESKGSVPPKLLKHVIDDGSFADTNVEIEYLGGILASSRTDTERDNRSIRFARMIDSLSNYQILSHYLIYRTVKDLFSGSGASANHEGRSRMRIFIPFPSFAHAMKMSSSELSKSDAIVGHVFFGLHDDSLIEDRFLYGPKEIIEREYQNAESEGIICQPSATGVQLFLWAFGKGDSVHDEIFKPDFDPKIDGVELGFSGAKAVFQTSVAGATTTT